MVMSICPAGPTPLPPLNRTLHENKTYDRQDLKRRILRRTPSKRSPHPWKQRQRDNNTKGGRNSWFARRSAGWTDSQIRSLLRGGGDNAGGIADKALSMVGDIILGVEGGKKKRMQRKRVGGPRTDAPCRTMKVLWSQRRRRWDGFQRQQWLFGNGNRGTQQSTSNVGAAQN